MWLYALDESLSRQVSRIKSPRAIVHVHDVRGLRDDPRHGDNSSIQNRVTA